MIIKPFFTALLFMMLIKGVMYIFAPKFVKHCCTILSEAADVNLLLFGWFLVVMAGIFWLSFVRYITC